MRFLLRRVAPADPDVIEVGHGGAVIPIRLRRNPAARRMTLRLSGAARGFTLTVPAGVPLATVRRFAEAQAGWAAARLGSLPARHLWAEGGTVPLRAVAHRLVSRPDGRFVARAGLCDGEAVIEVGGTADALPGRVERFLRAEALRDLRAAVARHTAALGLPARRVAVRDTRSRWGSCSSTGTLSFSWRLVLAPPFVLDYLAAHETAHLAEMNHSPRFWALTRRLCPDTDAAEAWLKGNGARLHVYG